MTLSMHITSFCALLSVAIDLALIVGIARLLQKRSDQRVREMVQRELETHWRLGHGGERSHG